MNVEVLGDDIYYGASSRTVFRKQYDTVLNEGEFLGKDWSALVVASKAIVTPKKGTISPIVSFRKPVYGRKKASLPTTGFYKNKFRNSALLKALSRKQLSGFLGDDEMMGLDWGALGKGILNVGKGIVKVVKSPGGKAITGAALTAVAGRLTPTQKAQIASAQEIAGMQPQVFTAGGNTSLATPEDTLKKNLPLILGGVGLLAAFALVAFKK